LSIVTNIVGCARCGASHFDIRFHALDVPVAERWTHWAPCPNNGQPILMEIVEEQAGDETYKRVAHDKDPDR
jgi:hypothetical protein